MDNKSSNKNFKLTREKLRTKLTSGTGDVVVKERQEVESFTQEEVEYLKVFKDDFLDKFWSDKRLLVYYLKTKAKEKTYDYLDLLYIEYDEKESTLEGLFRLFNDEKFVEQLSNLKPKGKITRGIVLTPKDDVMCFANKLWFNVQKSSSQYREWYYVGIGINLKDTELNVVRYKKIWIARMASGDIPKIRVKINSESFKADSAKLLTDHIYDSCYEAVCKLME